MHELLLLGRLLRPLGLFDMLVELFNLSQDEVYALIVNITHPLTLYGL
jgi:hypothetical protein